MSPAFRGTEMSEQGGAANRRLVSAFVFSLGE